MRLSFKRLLRHQEKHFNSFHKYALEPLETQNQVLLNYIKSNHSTQFGRDHIFHKIQNYDEYCDKVPLRDYNDFKKYIEQISQGKQHILTSGKVLRFEETSGTNSFNKLIPYTQALIDEFNAAISVWIKALSVHHPDAFEGRFYFSVSPPYKKNSLKQHSQIQVGSGRDLDYFSKEIGRDLMECLIHIDSNTSNLSVSKFFDRTVQKLLSDDVSLISIWSPSFFLQLDAALKRLSPAQPWEEHFPKLTILSCWSHGHSAAFIPYIKDRLGSISIQGKGLLSTEGVVSIPLEDDLDPVLSIHSHFYEFLSKQKKTYRAHELDLGEQYEVILTTGGGLYRYKTGDIIQVTGYYKTLPCIRFIGRKGITSDLVGEKLTEAHTSMAINNARNKIGAIGLAFIVPDSRERYALYVECSSRSLIKKFSKKVDEGLRENFYYDQARRLGQLKEFKVLCLTPHAKFILNDLILKSVARPKGVAKTLSLYSQDMILPIASQLCD